MESGLSIHDQISLTEPPNRHIGLRPSLLWLHLSHWLQRGLPLGRFYLRFSCRNPHRGKPTHVEDNMTPMLLTFLVNQEANNFNVYDVLEPRSDEDTDPVETYATYLTDATVIAAIGAQSTYAECPTGPYAKIVATGDEARSFLEPLAEVVQSGVNVLIWAGDLGENFPISFFLNSKPPGVRKTSLTLYLDWICNWYGSQLVVNNLNYTDAAEFQAKALEEYTVDGVSGGQFKTAGNLNFLRVVSSPRVPDCSKFHRDLSKC